MNITQRTVLVTTSAGGAYSADIFPEKGILMRISYKPDGSTPLDTGADLTITESNSGIVVYTQANIGTAAFTKLPRAPICSIADGVNSTSVFDYVPIADKLTLTIASGGATKSGTFYLVFGE